jgi:hypothetical protein
MKNRHFGSSRIILILALSISASVFLSCSEVRAQPLPDLIVTKIECVPPQSKLSFTVTNRSNVPLPKGWKAVAKVYLPERIEQTVDLGRPTSGSIEPAGGSASYLLAYDIKRKISAKVVADSTNSIRESNEGNNEKIQRLEPCLR